MKKLFFLLLLLPLACELVWHIQKSSFSSENVIQLELPVREAPREVQALLQKPFHYIGEGAQCFAFESTDKSCVIKLFKKEHRRFKNWKKEGILSCVFGWGRFEPAKRERSQEKWIRKFIDSCVRYETAQKS